MKSNKTLIPLFSLAFAFAAVPGFAQRGGGGIGAGLGAGAGIGLGGQTRVGTGSGVGVETSTNADVHARTSTSTSTGAGRAEAHSGAGIAAGIESNPELATRVRGMLSSGMSMSEAAAGFKNQGQFLAALHASQNLNIPFDDLKTKMTGSSAASLGSAIKASKPEMSDKQAKEEAKKAETQAKATGSARAHSSTTAKP
jgi:hypothetical protein